MSTQLDFVSIQKKPNVYFNGKYISRVIECQDGSKKTLGVIFPTDQPLTFKTHVSEKFEIIAGECEVWIGQNYNKQYKAGDSFNIPANSQFKIRANGVLDYICHLLKE